ncbi:fucolectin-5-like [Saccostrea echinata]|uniref:fucolectin-5-like n=1 Tax=Saccostrea echinata TaxID=191078 RepID=UPI002A840180|nr:fucolectin-5-like [Saccostrea echinata]
MTSRDISRLEREFGRPNQLRPATDEVDLHNINWDTIFVSPYLIHWISYIVSDNLALNSPVFMSSVFDDPVYAYQRLGNGSLAVNGEVKSDNTECSCTHRDLRPWLTADLLDYFFVRRVVFVNRKTSEDRLHDLNVTVGTNNVTFPCFCGFFSGPGTSHQKVDMVCAENCRGRYVRLQITSPVPEYLQLCEVEVYSDCNI